MTGSRTRATCLEDRGAAVTPPPQVAEGGRLERPGPVFSRPPRFQRGELANAQTFQSGTGGSRIPKGVSLVPLERGAGTTSACGSLRGSGAGRTRRPFRATPLATELLTFRIASQVAPAPRVERGSSPSEGQRQLRCCGDGRPDQESNLATEIRSLGSGGPPSGAVWWRARPRTARPEANAPAGIHVEGEGTPGLRIGRAMWRTPVPPGRARAGPAFAVTAELRCPCS